MFQDSSFVSTHLQGCGVEALLGIVEGQDDLKPDLMFLKPEGHLWQQFFLDAGLGFWQQWPDLDLSDYDDDESHRVDYMDLFSLQSATIGEIVCEPVGEDLASRILLRLSSGELELRPEDPAVLDSPSVVSWRSLANEYRRQRGWRDWPRIFDALPPLQGQTVLDLGCGVGDQAAELAVRGARVIGVDMNEDLLREAKNLANVEIRRGDLREPLDLEVEVDGVWCSFVAAYFPDLPAALASWSSHLRPGGWMALTEIDDLFGHEPLGARTKSLFEAYARDALAAGRYDFHMGGKLQDHLERSGFTVSAMFTLEDRELAFDGPASPEVVDAWRNRLDRMKLLQDFCGPDFERLREEFLGCLAHPGHRSTARVCCCMATRREA